MRIITPQNAAFQSSGAGPGAGLRLAASWSITEDVVADFGPTTVPIFIPNDGYYLWAAFVKTNVASAFGGILITMIQPGSGTTSSVNGNLAIVGMGGSQTTNSFLPLFYADGVFNVVREVSGFGGGPANYSAYVNLYLLAG